MGRPGLDLGTAGTVRVYATPTGFRAMTRYRDWDGVVRTIERAGKTKGAATRALSLALSDRGHIGAKSTVTRDSLFVDVAELWWSEAESRGLSPSTLDIYRAALHRDIIPALGKLHVREITTGVVDRHLKAIQRRHGAAVTKTSRTVLRGICALACRHDALPSNPCLNTTPLSTKPMKPPKALSSVEIHQLLAFLSYDDDAISRDIPDYLAFLLATGCRMGEACAVEWSAVDLTAGTVDIRATVLRIKGKGLIVKPTTKSVAGERVLELPSWCVSMLTARERTLSPYVFCTQLGNLRDPHNTTRDLRLAFRRIGYSGLTSHVFRKSVASMMSDAGISPRATADQLGHSQITTKMNSYLGRKTRKTGAADVLKGLFGQ